ncbi:MAG: hypothetical protein BGO26_05595 [Actinobacteria bacterium 69-20]|nr:MAG: hypothetical protein BGO26_05595 [Actinobacteria bacterium 69-20]
MRGAAATAGRGRAFRSALVTGAVVGAAAVAVAVAGCGTVPGAAVTVDGTQVSTEAVLARVTSVLDASAGASGSSAPADDDTRTQAARTQITDVIRHQLAERAAAESGITVSAKEVNDFIAQYDAYQKSSGSPDLGSVLQVPSASVNDAVYDLQVLDALIKKIPKSGVEVTNVSVTVDAVPASDWATAVADRVKFTADPAAMDAAAAAARAANPQLPGGAESLLEQPHHAAFGLFSAAQGEILLIPQGTQGYLVTRITKRVQAPATLTAQMITNANQTAGLSGEIALASLLFAKDAESARVQVNPRFGTWDPHIVQVVAASDAA